ncbi:glycosyltransferase family 4 protein [Trichothermofontia sp.]
MVKSELSNIHFWIPNAFEFKGGIQVYVYDFLKALVNHSRILKIKVHDKLDCSSSNFQIPDKTDFVFYGNYVSVLRTFYFSLSLFISALQDHPCLIICAHLRFAPVAFLIQKLLGIPYWIIVYGVDAWNVKDVLRKQSLKFASKIISVSEYTCDRLIQEQNLSTTKFSILPVTFDAAKFKIGFKPQYLLDRYNLRSNQPVILTICRLENSERYKGYDQIIKALPIIQKSIPDIHYILVGKGNDRSRIEDLIEMLNLQDYVTLAGFVPDEEICDHYNLCDVFAMPSKGEGFGIVYLEAMACGKPCLGGNQDGAIDALCKGQLGALVDPDSPEDIARVLTEILQGNYSNSLIYQPDLLRHKVIEAFGFEHFQKTLHKFINEYDPINRSINR